MSKASQKALTTMRKAQEEINLILQGPQNINNLLEINANFKKIESRLIYMGATLPEPGETPALRPNLQHRPLKAIFDRPINRVTTEDAEVLTADQKEVASPDQIKQHRYREAVNKLYARIGRMSPNTLLTNYRSDYDIKVLRGVAKIAGVEDFDTAKLTVEFVARINEAIKKKEAETAKQVVIDKSAVKGGEDVIVNQDQIDADPDLQELGAEPGDTISIHPKTKKKSIKAKHDNKS